MLITNAMTRKWTREEYSRIAESGIFGFDERVELIEGEVVVMTPPGPEHSYSVGKGTTPLVRLYGSTHLVWVQCPLDLSLHSQPQPDFALIPLDKVRRETLPQSADLVIEVSRSSLAFDRQEKLEMYARADIQDYWVVNLVNDQVEVHRDPGPLPGHANKVGYREVQKQGPHDSVRPLLVTGEAFPLSAFFT